jgi:hypothetical protein
LAAEVLFRFSSKKCTKKMYYGKNRFINIPARGRTNPTPALVKELVQRGETVYLQLLQ